MGIEPTTYSLGSCRSATELRPRTLVIFLFFRSSGPQFPITKRRHRNQKAALATSRETTNLDHTKIPPFDRRVLLPGAIVKLWESAEGTSTLALRPDVKVRWTHGWANAPGNPVDILYAVGLTLSLGARRASAARAPASSSQALP